MTARPTKAPLPGTDPSFHEFRKYLSPMTHKGKNILASFASCKHKACNYSSAWASNTGRELGMWRHRSEKVTEARLWYFMKLGFGPEKARLMMSEVADKHSHTWENWEGLVNGFIRLLAGVDLEDLPAFNHQAQYHLGAGAMDCAKAALDRELDIIPKK